ncbi:response regulator transcription factor [Angustibacter sp. McL0619]|uniref:helix-turn-helix transcriptional regulator n=1 Tax=Angustibacter sp. McL0619 TaxID=3415676 RepID=UPI003CF6DDE2
MTDRIATYVYARDAISKAGVTSQLHCCPDITIVDDAQLDTAQVAVVVTDVLDDETLRVLRGLRRGGVPGTVLVAAMIDDSAVVAAAEAGVCGMLRRSEATPAALGRACARVARGQGEVPADLLGHLLDQVGKLQRHVLAPRGLTFAGLTARETEVLRLVADGHGTAEIASQLCYSERTVKNVLHEVTTRLQLRNRSHAVAYAVREGLI